MDHYSGEEPINVGVGSEVSILELSQIIRQIVGYEGEIVCDPSRPDGMLRRIVDSSRINALGWQARTSLVEGLTAMYSWYLNTLAEDRP